MSRRRSEPGCVTAAGRGLPDRIVRHATSPARGRGSKQALGHRVVHVVQWWYWGGGGLTSCELPACTCPRRLLWSLCLCVVSCQSVDEAGRGWRRARACSRREENSSPVLFLE